MASSNPPTVIIGPLDNTLGAMFIGVVVAATLYGVSCVQTWFYYNHYKDDLWHIKLLVAASFISDTIHQALISHTVYTYVITNYDNPPMTQRLVWSLLVEVLFNGITALMVQIFFTIRVWKLSERNFWLTGAVLVLVIGEFCAVLAYTIKALQLQTFEQLAKLKDLSMTVNALAAAGDVIIAGVLCVMLHRSRTGFKQSDTMINKLIIFCVNTGLLTSMCAVMSLAFITALPNTFIYICFYFTLGRLYLNSLLATLNARKSIRSQAGPSDFSEQLSLPLTDVVQSPMEGSVNFKSFAYGLNGTGSKDSTSRVYNGGAGSRGHGETGSRGSVGGGRGIAIRIDTTTVMEGGMESTVFGDGNEEFEEGGSEGKLSAISNGSSGDFADKFDIESGTECAWKIETIHV